MFSEQIDMILANPYISGALLLFLVLYSSMARPSMPDWVAKLFENPLFRLLIMFLIAFTATKNTSVALMVSLTFMITLTLISEKSVAESFVEYQDL